MAKSYKKKRVVSKKTSAIALCILLALTVFFGIIGVNGMNLTSDGLYKLLPWLPNTDADNWPEAISLGLDLQGGVYVEYTAELPEGTETEASYQSLLEGTISVIANRLADKGYPESNVVQLGSNGIRVEIPSVTDPNTVLDLIGTTAEMTFLDPNGEVFMDGDALKTAYVTMEDGKYAIAFSLNSEGTALFGEMTAKNIGKNLKIMLDNEVLVDATVQSAITEGNGVITGNYTYDEAYNVAVQLQSGALPLKLVQQKVDTVSATLGVDALSTSVKAAIIGILLVMLIMIIRYRLSGLAADLALFIYILLVFFLMAVLPGIQLTLAGIAGVVLGIGMAVDANVVIFERFGEELARGRSVKGALKSGFKNAMSAVIDANVTTIIAAIVLLIFGTGTVQGFATTLLLSVIVSMFTAIIVTRFIMTHLTNLVGTPKLYSGKAVVKEEE